MVEFDSSILSGESPVYSGSGLISFCLQGLDLLAGGFFIRNGPAQDSPPQDAKLDLCHVEPTTLFGSVV